MRVSVNVRREIARFLRADGVPLALAALESAELPFVSGASDRIQFALLLLARDWNVRASGAAWNNFEEPIRLCLTPINSVVPP